MSCSMMEITVYKITAVVFLSLLAVRISQAKNITIRSSSNSSTCRSPMGILCKIQGDGAIFYFKKNTSMEYIAECQFTNGPYAHLMNGTFNNSYTIERNYSTCILTIKSLSNELSGTYICKEMYAETNFVTHNVSCTDYTSNEWLPSGLPIWLIIGLSVIGFIVIVCVVGFIYTRKVGCNNGLTGIVKKNDNTHPVNVAACLANEESVELSHSDVDRNALHDYDMENEAEGLLRDIPSNRRINAGSFSDEHTQCVRHCPPHQTRAESVSEEHSSDNHSEMPDMSLNDTQTSTSYHFDHPGRVKSKSYFPQEQCCRRLQTEPVCDRSCNHTVFDENRPSENQDNTLSLRAKKDIVNGTENVNIPVDTTDAPTRTLTRELLEEIHKQDAEKYNSGGIPDGIEKENNDDNSCASPPQTFIEQNTRDKRKELRELSNRKLITKGGESS